MIATACDGRMLRRLVKRIVTSEVVPVFYSWLLVRSELGRYPQIRELGAEGEWQRSRQTFVFFSCESEFSSRVPSSGRSVAHRPREGGHRLQNGPQRLVRLVHLVSSNGRQHPRTRSSGPLPPLVRVWEQAGKSS